MSVDIEKLEAAALAATQGRNFDRLPEAGGGLKYECTGDDGSLVLKVDHKNDEWGFVGENGEADEAFFLACTPAAVLELIANYKSSQKHWENESNNVQALMAEVERHRAYADKCESAAAGFSRQLQTALIELKALQGEKAAQGAIRKERQAEGIEKARAEGKYQGRPVDADLHARVIDLLQNGHGVRPTARLAKCSTTTVIRIKAALSNGEQS